MLPSTTNNHNDVRQVDKEIKEKLREAEEVLRLTKEAWLPLWAHGKYNEV